MIRTMCLVAALLLLPFSRLAAQDNALTGKVIDTSAVPIPFTTVSLLQPEDSTLSFFGITNANGDFSIRNIAKGKYLVQVAFMGFSTYYKKIDIPYKDGNYGVVMLVPVAVELGEMKVTGERIPVVLKKDTVEYNAGAFKTRPDASVEELLKKMPGIQVDHDGNVKAQGEDVRKVLVDGKEFFGSDPKVATQNLPADAINKVQVFNKKSDAAEFTGIDDGSREKTINLMLKDGKKVGYFGDVQAGAGTDERYKLNGKLYKFRQKSQFAAIGMMNNINQSGFSFQDYLNFNGGMRNLMAGGPGGLELGDNLPIDFGRPVTGLINSGAAGLNYSYEPRKNNRIAVSYLGNGAEKKLLQDTRTENFTTGDPFIRNDNNNEFSRNLAHRLSLNIRKDMDSVNQFTLAGNASLSDSRANGITISSSTVRDVVLNRLDSRTEDNGNSGRGSGSASYLRNVKGNWPIFRAGADVGYDKTLTRTEWYNITNILSGPVVVNDNQFQRDEAVNSNYELNTSITRSMGHAVYLDPELRGGYNTQGINRQQGMPQADVATDSLSPDFGRDYRWLRPGFTLRKSATKDQVSVALRAEVATLSTRLKDVITRTDKYLYALPSASWHHEYSSSKRLSLGYNSTVTAPRAARMLPVLNSANPVQRYIGSNDLRPEYQHRVNANWIKFDQFSMTSLFANASAAYTLDKISVSRTINPDLTQTIMPVNVAGNLDANARVEYGMPIRKLKVNVNLELSERYERGISIVNTVGNTSNTLTHELRLTIDNRKKNKLDVSVGSAVNVSNASYSVDRSLNNTFYNFTGFSEINLTPSSRWNFQVIADVTQYNARSFDKAVIVPILKAEASYYFLKNKRGVLSLYGFDLLDQNKGIERISELNYLRQTTSNIIGRYGMLSFKYKIGKTGGGNMGNIDIKVR